MSRRVYNKRVRLGSYYDMNVNYNGKIIKHTDLKLVKVTSKGYNFLDVEINKVLYFKSHYYRYKNDFLKGDDLITLVLPLHIAIYEVEPTVWEDFVEENLPLNGLIWIKYEGLKQPVKTHFLNGIVTCKYFSSRKDAIKMKQVIYKNK